MSNSFLIDGAKKGRIERLEIPDPGLGEILIKIRASGVCTTDRRIFSGEIRVPTPVLGGHEIAGEIVELGPGVKGLSVGERVSVDSINRCGSCYFCRRGLDNLCINSRKQNKLEDVFMIAGGFSEYMVVERKKVFVGADDVRFVDLAMSEPLACCINSVGKAPLDVGDSALVVGGGTMGLLHAILLKNSGVTVVVSDPAEERRSIIEDNGIEAIAPERIAELASLQNEGNGFDAVFLTAPAIETLENSIGATRRGGTLVLYSSLHPDSNVGISWNAIHYSELSIVGTEGRKAADFRRAVSLISRGMVDLKSVVTKEIPIEELEEELLRSPSGSDQRTIVVF